MAGRTTEPQNGFAVEYPAPEGWGDFVRLAQQLDREHPADGRRGSWHVEWLTRHRVRYTWQEG